ncbi:hypothetical protein ACWCY6_43385 [Streptomyces sp. 900105755]
MAGAVLTAPFGTAGREARATSPEPPPAPQPPTARPTATAPVTDRYSLPRFLRFFTVTVLQLTSIFDQPKDNPATLKRINSQV